MSINSEIAAGLRAICKSSDKTDVFTAEVTAVDIPSRTCSVLGIGDKGSVEYTNVLLMAVVDDGMLYKPKVGSTVLVGNNKNQQPFIMMFSELDGILWIVGDSTIDVTGNLIEFNGGGNLGIPNVKPLFERIKALEELTNAINDNWNNFASTYIPGSPTTTGLPASLLAPPFTTPDDITPIIQQSDIEDTKITH